MTKPLSRALLIAAFGLAAGITQAAIIITTGGNTAPGHGQTTSVAGATITTFDNAGQRGCSSAASFGYGGSGTVRSGSTSGVSAAPAGDSSCYLTIARNQSSSASYGSAQDYFGLYWGSIDSYNTISFFNGSDLVGAFGGAAVPGSGPFGNWTSTSDNQYVNFWFTGSSLFDRVLLTSGNNAFESDNHAVARVPEPATLGLLGLGLLGVAAARRRRRGAAARA